MERWAMNRNQHLVAAQSLTAGLGGNSWSRAFTFLKQSVRIAWAYKQSLAPTAIAVVLCLAIAVGCYLGLAQSRGPDWEPTYLELFMVLFPQYLIFYFCMGMTILMVFGYLVGERVSIGTAFWHATIRLPNIVLLASIGTVMDITVKTLRQRQGLLGSLVAHVIELLWTVASFLVLPAIMIDGLTFPAAIKRTRDAARRNLIPIGVGEVAVRGLTWVVSFLATGLIVAMMIGLSVLLPGASLIIPAIVAIVLWVVAISIFNVYVRTVYYTSLYVWTVATEEAEAVGGRLWVPAPLAEAMG
jgi:hypothetical protein